jgi:hypothetical protein
VAPGLGEANCLDNDQVPYDVQLELALGDRVLVDGSCLSGPASTTSHCAQGAQRWPRRRARGPAPTGCRSLSEPAGALTSGTPTGTTSRRPTSRPRRVPAIR